jgi:hypothetical protein
MTRTARTGPDTVPVCRTAATGHRLAGPRPVATLSDGDSQ